MEKNIGNFVQRAFYLGMGLASLAADKASSQLAELRKQAQKLAEDLVERGEMTTDEARAFLDSLMKQGQGTKPAEGEPTSSAHPDPAAGPRKITIDDMEDGQDSSAGKAGALELTEAARLRQQIGDLQAELDRLKGLD
jgi:polyhydroxyalkanoate synthesis regulator phasin